MTGGLISYESKRAGLCKADWVAAPSLSPLRSCLLKRGVGAVRKYRVWSRAAREQVDGYANESSPALKPQVISKRALSGARATTHHDTSARRRRVLELLVCAVAVPALVALATGSSTAWWVFVGMLPVFGVYLGVVLYARRVRAEREINVAFFGSAGRSQRGWDDVFSGSDSQLDEVSA
jgi:hypothetical protein